MPAGIDHKRRSHLALASQLLRTAYRIYAEDLRADIKVSRWSFQHTWSVLTVILSLRYLLYSFFINYTLARMWYFSTRFERRILKLRYRTKPKKKKKTETADLSKRAIVHSERRVERSCRLCKVTGLQSPEWNDVSVYFARLFFFNDGAGKDWERPALYAPGSTIANGPHGSASHNLSHMIQRPYWELPFGKQNGANSRLEWGTIRFRKFRFVARKRTAFIWNPGTFIKRSRVKSKV